MAIDHITIPVVDMVAAERFYEAVLAPLGMGVIGRDADAVGFGAEDWTFGVYASDTPVPSLHIAFAAADKAAVDAFYDAGLKAGGTSNGAPGLREQYGAGYYAAYLTCPDGHNVEAVVRGG